MELNMTSAMGQSQRSWHSMHVKDITCTLSPAEGGAFKINPLKQNENQNWTIKHQKFKEGWKKLKL